MRQVVGNTLRGAAIPQLWDAATLAAAGQDFVDPAQDGVAVAADHGVRALVDGDRALGVLSQRQAWHAERGGLFLQPLPNR